MAALLALVGAALYGTADFGGGLASRRAPAVQVSLASQLVGLVVVVPLVALQPEPAWTDLAWGAGAGFFGGLALTAFYRALAGGTMSVVAPVSAVTAAGLPALFGLLSGERPGALQVVGIPVALLAIVLVSQEREEAPAPVGEGPTPHTAHVDEAGEHDTPRLSRRRALGLALLAGMLFALLFVFFDRAGDGALPWALVGARCASVPTLLLLALGTRTPLRPERSLWPLVGAVGVLDMLANVFVLLAFERGLLTVVAVLSSLYPAMTVVLARVLLHERLRGVQLVGLGAALAAVALISAG